MRLTAKQVELGGTRVVRRRGSRDPFAPILTRSGMDADDLVRMRLVGYENFSVFSTAFRKHFGRPPSAFQPGAGRSRRRIASQR